MAALDSVFRLLVPIFCVFSFYRTDGLLTTTPENVLVLRGEDAVLNCSTDSTSSTGHNPIIWHYDNDIASYSPCTAQIPGFVTSPPDSATDCNIRALSSNEHGISGVYKCEEQGRPSTATGAVATVIVLDPVCEVVQPATEGLDATLVCRMTYDWQGRSRQYNAPPQLGVSLSWMGVSGTTVNTTADPATFSGTLETNMTVHNIMSINITSYSCTVTFNFSPGSLDQVQQYAVNPVSYTYTCQPPPERLCPTTMKVTPSSGPYKAGDVLTCMSDGYPEPSYTWTDSNGVIVSNGPNVTLTNSSFVLNCTATVSATDACSASVVVHRSVCPTTVKVIPYSGPYEAGDVLTCMSDGYPEPSYTWTDSNGVVISTGPNVTLTNSSFVLNCTATVNLTEACSASVAVHRSVCPTTVKVSPSSGLYKAGDVLTCMSDGYPEPSYTWTDSSGIVISTGPNVTLTNSSFVLNCTATVNLTEACSASVAVHRSVCPSSAKVIPSSGPYKAGDVLTCVSDGYPEPSYTWTDSDGVVISTGPNVTLTNSSFVLNCTATVSATDACSASIAVNNTDMPISGGDDGKEHSVIGAVVGAVVGFTLLITVFIFLFYPMIKTPEGGNSVEQKN